MAPVMNRQDSRARAEEAVRLRAVGRTYSEIAVALGYGSAGAAHTAIVRLQQRTPAVSPDGVRRSASEGLRVVRSMLFEQFADAKQRGDNDDMVMIGKEIRQNITEDAKLHGAHAPQRAELDVKVSASAAEAVNRLEQELLAISAQRHQHHVPQIIEGEVVR